MTSDLPGFLLLTVAVSAAYWFGWLSARFGWAERVAVAERQADSARGVAKTYRRQLDRQRAADLRPGGRMLADVYPAGDGRGESAERGEPA